MTRIREKKDSENPRPTLQPRGWGTPRLCTLAETIEVVRSLRARCQQIQTASTRPPAQYDPSTIQGSELLAHELVHVGQYRIGELTKSKYLRELLKHGSGPKNKYEAPGYAMEIDVHFSLPAYLEALRQLGTLCGCEKQ